MGSRQRLLGVLQAFFFPQPCVLCREPARSPDLSPLCSSCRGSLEPLQGPVCWECGVPLPGSLGDEGARCFYCLTRGFHFERARAWGSYCGKLREVIRHFKFEGQKRLAAPLADCLAQVWSREFRREPFDWIVPVPAHRKRRRQRGFDQTLLLARALSGTVSLPVFPHLERCRSTPPLPGLSRRARRRALQGAFQVRRPQSLAGTRVLLVDDVMTTGTTLDVISSVLKEQAEVRAIGAVTVARVARWQPW